MRIMRDVGPQNTEITWVFVGRNDTSTPRTDRKDTYNETLMLFAGAYKKLSSSSAECVVSLSLTTFIAVVIHYIE